MVLQHKSTAEEVSFKWSQHRISLLDSKVRTTLRGSIIGRIREGKSSKRCKRSGILI